MFNISNKLVCCTCGDSRTGRGRAYEIIDFMQLWLVKPAAEGLLRMVQDINLLAF